MNNEEILKLKKEQKLLKKLIKKQKKYNFYLKNINNIIYWHLKIQYKLLKNIESIEEIIQEINDQQQKLESDKKYWISKKGELIDEKTL